MENMEIILSDMNKGKINTFLNRDFKIKSLNVKSSHFYDNKKKMDLTLLDVEDFEYILSPIGTGNIVLEKLDLGIEINDVVIILSFDEVLGDIVINFPESEVLSNEYEEIQRKLLDIITYTMNLKEKYNIPKVIFGYEPATSPDSMLLELTNNMVNYEKEIDKLIQSLSV